MRVLPLVALAVLVTAPVLAQDEQSKMISKLSPEQIQALVNSRQRAYAELRTTASAYESSALSQALYDRATAIGIFKITKITPQQFGGTAVTLTLTLERTLRGEMPHEYTDETALNANPISWIKGPPPAWVHVPPTEGKRVVVAAPEANGISKNTPVLDLDDPQEAAKLQAGERFLSVDKVPDMIWSAPFIALLGDPAPLVRDLAVRRLLHSGTCQASAECARVVIAEAGRKLASAEPTDRREAVNWLREISDAIQARDPGNGRNLGMAREPLRAVLAKAMEDRNVAVGDEAFAILEQLDFHAQENVGYCIEIVPALRKSERYPKSADGRVIGGPLNGASSCLYHWNTAKN
jgi:hypothetical protein